MGSFQLSIFQKDIFYDEFGIQPSSVNVGSDGIGVAVADATDAATTMARLNDLLARVRTHGLIAT